MNLKLFHIWWYIIGHIGMSGWEVFTRFWRNPAIVDDDGVSVAWFGPVTDLVNAIGSFSFGVSFGALLDNFGAIFELIGAVGRFFAMANYPALAAPNEAGEPYMGLEGLFNVIRLIFASPFLLGIILPYIPQILNTLGSGVRGIPNLFRR